jgi:outer membrane protein insertion porin family
MTGAGTRAWGRRIAVALVALLAGIGAGGTLYAQSGDDWYVGKPIADVRFDGLRHADESDLREIVRPYVEREFTLDLFWELQGRLYATDLFESLESNAVAVDDERSAVIIEFLVQERPVVGSVDMVGNQRVRDAELLEVMELSRGDVFDPIKLDADESAVRGLYVTKGYPDAVVTIDTVRDDEAGEVAVIVQVVEGFEVTVEEIRFVGNEFASESTLRGRMRTKKRSLFESGAFREVTLQEDEEIIEAYYASHGYVDAVVDRIERELVLDADQQRRSLSLTIYLTEGEQYSYGGMSFEGNAIFSDDELSGLVRHGADREVNREIVEADFVRVQDRYYENGYIFNLFELFEERNEDTRQIAYRVVIQERERAHIENIVISGAEKTRDHVILRELPFEVGDVFNRTEIVRGLQNLYNLQYFTSVEPGTPPGSAPGLMDVQITVEEGTTADIGFGATFSGGDFPLSGFVRWSERNFSGLGQTVSVDLSASQLRQALSLGFREPWLLGQPWSAGITLGGEHSVVRGVAQDVLHPVFTDAESEQAVPDPYVSKDDYSSGTLIPDQYTMQYDTFAISAEVSSGYRFDTLLGRVIVRGGFGSSLEFLVYDPQVNRPFDKTIRDQFERWSVVNSLWTGVAWDRRDFFLNPTDGTLLSQRVTLTGGPLSGDRHFIVLDSQAEAFATLFELPVSDVFDLRVVLAGHTGFSVILPQLRSCGAVTGDPGLCWDQVLGQEDLLIIDGTSVGRGWEPVLDGEALWDNKLELRVPIDPQIIWGVVFLDAALLWDDRGALGDTSLDDVHFSAGFGLRFAVPQLPLRLYLAKPFAFQDGRLGDPPGTPSSGPLGGMNLVLGLGGDTF